MTDEPATPPVAVASKTLRELVVLIIKAAEQPVTVADLKKKLKERGVAVGGRKGYADADIEAAVNEETAAGTAFIHPASTAKGRPKFWHSRPKTTAELVADALRAKVQGLSADAMVTDKQLGKPTGRKATPEATESYDTALADLLATQQLFRRGKGYSKTPPQPPKWYEGDPGKKPFDALVKAVKKVTDLGVAPLDEVLALLRQKLGTTSPPPPSPAAAAPPVASPLNPTPAGPPAADLRTVLKQAYDHLCLFIEFRDKLVELPRLYHDASKRLPGLTAEKFQDELWRLSEQRLLQLHVLNEVREAKEPHLAIHRNDRLYYFVRWN